MSNLKLCMMTYTMSRQNRGWTPEDFIKTAVDCGLKGIDWITTYGRNPKELRKMTEDGGLTVACHTFFCRELLEGKKNWLDSVKQSVQNAVELNAPVVMIPTPGNSSLYSREASRDFWISALQKIVPITQDARIILTIENFPGLTSPFVTSDDFHKLKSEIPDLKLTFDNGNAATGENPIESLSKTIKDIVHVHFKDWYKSSREKDGYRQMLDGNYYKPALIGDGVVDTKGCLEKLKEYNYNGFINIEYEGDDIPADIAIKRAVMNLSVFL